jgi:hypothetical protein
MICGQEPTLQDLADVDFAAAARLRQVARCASEADFPEVTYSVLGATGEVLELFPGGAEKRVAFADRAAYVASALEARLQELSFGSDAIRFGLHCVVPKRALALFTAVEVEQAACGDPIIDVELLRRHTAYKNGYNETHETVERFWRVFEDLSNDDRCGLVRFAWGRSRLPAERDFKQQFKLSTQASTDSLPNAHTCFFQIDLPAYETDEKMRKYLMMAVAYGLSGHFLIA